MSASVLSRDGVMPGISIDPLAGDVRELLAYKREILSLPWILTQHGKRGDGRLVKLPASRFCRLLGAFVGDEAFS